jgi:beta-phosphoglucomutase-like phosphatase (HAD superfamily)
MKKQMRRCKHCHCLFEVCNKVEKHEYCKKTECQKARKRKWQKMQKDEQYRKDQKEAQEIWLQNNPDYWRKYRLKNKEYTAQNKEKQRDRNQAARSKSRNQSNPDMIAKMDALKQKNVTFSGQYELVPFMPGKIAKMDAIIVEINTISNGYS